MSTRGERIHQKARNIARWLRIFRFHRRSWDSETDEQMQLRAKRTANHGKTCSCLMCGNARKHAGDTLQERRARQKEREL